MALSTGAAILGAAIIGGGASLASSKTGTSAAKDASQYATDQSAQVQREALQIAQGNTAVARAGGDAAILALLDRMGIDAGPQLTANGVQARNGASAPGSPDYAAYVRGSDDLAQAYQAEKAANPALTEEQFGQRHWSEFGQREGRALPTVAAPDTATAPAPPATAPTAPGTLTDTSSQVVPLYQRQADTPAPTYTAPAYTRGEYTPQLDLSVAAFDNSPEAQAARLAYERIANGTNSQFAATGALQSGAAAKALQDRAQANTIQYYGNFASRVGDQYNTDRARFDANYNFDTGLDSQNKLAYNALNNDNWRYGQQRTDQNFNLDRAYATDLALGNQDRATQRYNTTTNSLFTLAGLGQGAGGQATGAATNYANNTSNALFSNAANVGNAAIANAANTNNLVNTGANALAYYYGNKKG